MSYRHLSCFFFFFFFFFLLLLFCCFFCFCFFVVVFCFFVVVFFVLFCFCPGTFSEFEPRQILDQCQITFDSLLGVMMSGIWQSVWLDIVNSMCLQNFIKIYQKVQEICSGSLFFQNLNLGKNLNQSQMTFDNLLDYILSISICMQNFITIFHSFQEIGPFSLFQNLEPGKASTEDKCHFAISWVRSCQYQNVCKISSQYSAQFKR